MGIHVACSQNWYSRSSASASSTAVGAKPSQTSGAKNTIMPLSLPVQPSRSEVASVNAFGEWCTACVAQNQRTR